jgi:ribonuclease R
VGRIRVHPAGYGFVEREDKADDIFIPAKFRGGALDGDRVSVYTWEGYKGTEGRVEEVLSRGRAKLTGAVRRTGRSMFLDPDDPRISQNTDSHLILEDIGAAHVGDCVLAEITQYPTSRNTRIAARVVRVLGPPDDPRTEVAKIVACADIPEEFPPDALRQAAATPDKLRKTDLADRIDLRDRPFLTIDPETARDFDDAICLEDAPGGGWRVWVAVADVSHYVRPDDALDRESQIRGVSVYFPDRSIPMLPRELSSEICSLNPGVDRCAMVARLDLDDEARIVDTDFAAAVIRSHARLDYPGVAAALAGDFRGRVASYRKWKSELEAMDRLARAMRKRRMERGALELDVPEAKVVLDDDDPLLVRDVVRAKGNQSVRRAYELVEEFMLAANESVGGFFERRGLPTVWRVHAPPVEKKLHELHQVLDSFGVDVDEDEASTPRGMKRVLEAIKGKPAERALMFLVLRSLTQAVYSTENLGHFGLASDCYLHFTSPIRRYPDVLVHRLLKHYLHREGKASGGGGDWGVPEVEQLDELAAACSGYERRAAEAEREVVDMYQAYLMRDRLGDEFSARISGITNFGVFVEIEEPFVEGLIKLESLGNDRFDFDARLLAISGRRSGARFRVGDPLRVELINVSIQRRQLDFQLVGTPPKPKQPTGGKGKGKDKNKDRGDRASRRRKSAAKRR